MSRRFYPTRTLPLALLALLPAACGGDEPEPPAPAQDDTRFHLATPLPAYQPPAEGEMDARLLEKLRSGSKNALRFAKEAIGARGEEIVPALLDGLRAELRAETTATTNFLSALIYTGTDRELPILVEVLEQHPLPLVRSQALDTIARLRPPGIEDAVLAYAERETEAGPRSRLVPALAALGGDGAVAWLVDVVAAWRSEARRNPLGATAWEALLTVDSPAAAAAIEGLVDEMAPAQRAAGITRLIHLGQIERAEEVRAFLDPDVYVSAGVRRKAVEGLAVAGDFAGLMPAQDDPDLRVRLAVVDALRLEAAAASDFGHEHLVSLATGEDEDLAVAALEVLAARGDTAHIEPWLTLLQGYPTRPRSVSAARVFLRAKAIDHPGLVPILIQRWPACGDDQRIDIGRVMAVHPTAEAVDFLLARIRDEEESADVRLYTINSLGNCGEIAIEAMLELWQDRPAPEAGERLINALFRFPEDPRVRALLTEVAVSPDSPDYARALVLATLPKAYGLGAFDLLMQAREQARRDTVKLYIEQLLHEFY